MPKCPIHDRELGPPLDPDKIKTLQPGERPLECPLPECSYKLILPPTQPPTTTNHGLHPEERTTPGLDPTGPHH